MKSLETRYIANALPRGLQLGLFKQVSTPPPTNYVNLQKYLIYWALTNKPIALKKIAVVYFGYKNMPTLFLYKNQIS